MTEKWRVHGDQCKSKKLRGAWERGWCTKAKMCSLLENGFLFSTRLSRSLQWQHRPLRVVRPSFEVLILRWPRRAWQPFKLSKLSLDWPLQSGSKTSKIIILCTVNKFLLALEKAGWSHLLMFLKVPCCYSSLPVVIFVVTSWPLPWLKFIDAQLSCCTFRLAKNLFRMLLQAKRKQAALDRFGIGADMARGLGDIGLKWAWSGCLHLTWYLWCG